MATSSKDSKAASDQVDERSQGEKLAAIHKEKDALDTADVPEGGNPETDLILDGPKARQPIDELIVNQNGVEGDPEAARAKDPLNTGVSPEARQRYEDWRDQQERAHQDDTG